MKRTINLFSLIIFIMTTACSTVLNTTTQEIEVKSNPANAKITIDGKKFGLTPQIVNLERGSNHVVKLELDGYEVYETQITRKISFWFWGNALNGFIPGMVTDMFTGSMYNLLPEKISVELIQAKQEKGKKL
ncbi:PEGA domain-containing protein [Stygiobacter electus]|uniref:PEGA domain-containing protein n=1 Tax=Stygiobacter electus TaxID=3032292 RepID=A0AAE3TD39_9BACT|nr:PEGA domain-containing protein [Stygiobacter electus]MDF1613033.1 PEGA domain-containing protein [Stygiobacter electus]